MDVTLSFMERLVLAGVLPRTGDAITLWTSKRIIDRLMPTPEEIERSGLKTENDRLWWNPQNEPPPSVFAFSEPETGLIVSTLKDLDRRRQLSMDLLSVYSKFAGGPETCSSTNTTPTTTR